ncbi:dienelactone hydrolase family protein [Rheinheimera sp. 1928-s]|uniref:dienelactone hydrolase family protein n=1 Tax=Rheinheimera sp. 1928-s TaxID=3033803 RepID=UPI0026399B1C|nr:dienelactone hydrolase family protein [Rheinheimera sp. 1928-s]MDF3125920.1 dienelactone hydrolase family protein [Rheinheimera sp. 1928-s]
MSERKTAKDFHPETLRLFDRYVHGDISRRDFLAGAAKFAVAGMTAVTILQALTPNYAMGQQIQPDDPAVDTHYLTFPSPKGYGELRGYLAKPKQQNGKLPLVLVVHENRGLNPHIEDVTRRLALAGFIAFAPDALYPLGGYPGDEDKARQLFGTLDQDKTRQDFIESVRILQKLPEGNGKVGVVGFCYGGGMSNFLATELADLSAAVPFYGRQGDLDKVAAIKAPLLIHYASDDERVNTGAKAYDDALKAAGKNAQSFIYPDTQHGFHNDTTPRYDKAAAELAWSRTIEFFKQHLS